eukprot:TRINITY_DN62205_c0_g1_i1.p1 TRINITY_DN62205_c0_g1~~TRINITY_DN62205_c0_g1_i1.p1  ORF type:complete len:547 (-),score=76.95 TRINITY_DN62205_c0_g1_i1:135-1700(-)
MDPGLAARLKQQRDREASGSWDVDEVRLVGPPKNRQSCSAVDPRLVQLFARQQEKERTGLSPQKEEVKVRSKTEVAVVDPTLASLFARQQEKERSGVECPARESPRRESSRHSVIGCELAAQLQRHRARVDAERPPQGADRSNDESRRCHKKVSAHIPAADVVSRPVVPAGVPSKKADTSDSDTPRDTGVINKVGFRVRGTASSMLTVAVAMVVVGVAESAALLASVVQALPRPGELISLFSPPLVLPLSLSLLQACCGEGFTSIMLLCALVSAASAVRQIEESDAWRALLFRHTSPLWSSRACSRIAFVNDDSGGGGFADDDSGFGDCRDLASDAASPSPTASPELRSAAPRVLTRHVGGCEHGDAVPLSAEIAASTAGAAASPTAVVAAVLLALEYKWLGGLAACVAVGLALTHLVVAVWPWVTVYGGRAFGKVHRWVVRHGVRSVALRVAVVIAVLSLMIVVAPEWPCLGRPWAIARKWSFVYLHCSLVLFGFRAALRLWLFGLIFYCVYVRIFGSID